MVILGPRTAHDFFKMDSYLRTNQLFSGSNEYIEIKPTDTFVHVPVPTWWADIPNLGPTEMGQLIEPYAISAFGNSFSHVRAHAPLDGYVDDRRRYTGSNLGVKLFQQNRDLGLYGMRHNLANVYRRSLRDVPTFSGSPIEVKYTYGFRVTLTPTQWSVLHHYQGYLLICKHASSRIHGPMLMMAAYRLIDGEAVCVTDRLLTGAMTVNSANWKSMDDTTYDLL